MFHFNEIYITRGRKHLYSLMHNVSNFHKYQEIYYSKQLKNNLQLMQCKKHNFCFQRQSEIEKQQIFLKEKVIEAI
jgi:hypothetical protein